jgi:hypothetical protein
MLFMDYLSIKSNNHVLSILGNHEINNIQKFFYNVNLSKIKPSLTEINAMVEKENEIIRKIQNKENIGKENIELLNLFLSNKRIIPYLNKRRDMFLKNGIFGKIIRRRNFIILFNDLIISHAGVLQNFINSFGINSTIDVKITNINFQINMKKNWIDIEEINNPNVIKNLYLSQQKTYNEKELTQSNNYTKIFQKISDDSKISPILNRELSNLSTIKDNKQLITTYINVIGHNPSENIKYVNIDNKDIDNKDNIDNKVILTDCGWHNKNHPYFEIVKITYISNVKTIENIGYGLVHDYKKKLNEINIILNTDKYDPDIKYEPPPKKNKKYQMGNLKKNVNQKNVNQKNVNQKNVNQKNVNQKNVNQKNVNQRLKVI